MSGNWDDWGHLKDRYKPKDDPADNPPRRILALDGGGIRGLMTVRFLVSLEEKLAAHYGNPADFRLCQFFDYIGGTSTGAIIAASLARGMSATDLLDFYKSFGREVFKPYKWYEKWKMINNLYSNGPLEAKLKDVYGEDSNLLPQHLQTLLLVVTRNATTDSAWPISSNPFAKYNALDRDDCNLKIPLWQLVRASTAAPVYFPPEVLHWDPNDPSKSFVFVDGGTTPYNNPAFLMVRMATEPAYKLNWKRSEQDLLVISAGTGGAPSLGASIDDPNVNVASNVVKTLSASMGQAQVDQDYNCRTVGRCVFGNQLDREVGTLIPDAPLTEDLGRSFLYARYDAELTDDGLAALGLADVDPEKVSKLDSIEHMDDLERIGQAVGEQVNVADFGSFMNAPLWAPAAV